MKGIKLKGIELETKEGKEVSLTIKEAKDLYSQLDELFGKNIQFIPSQPIIIERDNHPWKMNTPYWDADYVQPPVYVPPPVYGSGDSIGFPPTTICGIKGDSGLNVKYMG